MDILRPNDSSAPPRRRRRRIVAVVIIAFALSSTAFLLLLRPQRERTDALERAGTGDLDGAMPSLLKALERDPRDVEVLEALARGYSTSGDAQRATDYLDQWIAERPDAVDALRLRMELLVQRRELKRAEADGLRLIELKPDDIKLRKTVLGIAMAAADFETAERLCRECLNAEPGDIALRTRLASIRAERGATAEAVALLEVIIQQQPNQFGAMQSLAMMYNEMGQPEKAVPLLRQIVDSDPTRQRTANYQLSLALGRVGKPDEAKRVLAEVRRRQDVEVFREAIRSQPENLELRVRLAESLLADGHANDGLALLAEVLNRDPRYPPAHQALADHYRRIGDTANAARHAKLAELP